MCSATAGALLALGVYPDLSLKDARKRRDEARQLLADGIDPTAQRKTIRQARRIAASNTLEATARAWLDHRADAWVVRYRALMRRHPGVLDDFRG